MAEDLWLNAEYLKQQSPKQDVSGFEFKYV